MNTKLKCAVVAMLTLLFAFAGAASAQQLGKVEWNWNDETMGISKFKKDFGKKKWHKVYFHIKNTAGRWHYESRSDRFIYIKLDGQDVYKFDNPKQECLGPGEWRENTVIIEADPSKAKVKNLTFDGWIQNCARSNTGRVRLHVEAWFYK